MHSCSYNIWMLKSWELPIHGQVTKFINDWESNYALLNAKIKSKELQMSNTFALLLCTIIQQGPLKHGGQRKAYKWSYGRNVNAKWDLAPLLHERNKMGKVQFPPWPWKTSGVLIFFIFFWQLVSKSQV